MFAGLHSHQDYVPHRSQGKTITRSWQQLLQPPSAAAAQVAVSTHACAQASQPHSKAIETCSNSCLDDFGKTLILLGCGPNHPAQPKSHIPSPRPYQHASAYVYEVCCQNCRKNDGTTHLTHAGNILCQKWRPSGRCGSQPFCCQQLLASVVGS